MADEKGVRWATPSVIDDATVVFPANVCGALLPPMNEIPDEFKDWNSRNSWRALVSRWFFKGLTGHFVPKDGIDYNAAMRHVRACMGSWEPKHEHKEAGVAYLLSLWFDRYEEATS